MPFSPTRLWAAILAGSLIMTGAAVAETKKPAPAKPAASPAPAAPAADPAQAPQPGQAGQPTGPVKVDLVAVQPNWTKVCPKDPNLTKELCIITRDFGVQADQPMIALAIFDSKGEDTRIVRVLMPLTLLLRPGFRISVDKAQPLEGSYEFCFVNGCFGEARVKAPTIDALKKGTTLTISARNQANNQIDFNVPLSNFGEAFDGPAIDPKVLEEQQKKLQAELQKRAEEERKRLEAAQPPGSGTGGAAAPAGAPAQAPK